MSDEGSAMRPEHLFKKLIWRGSIEVGEALERSTTWTTGGVAAVVAVLVGNLDSASKIATLEGIKTAVVLLALSLLFGAMSKILGMAVVAGVKTLRQTEAFLGSEPGLSLMTEMTIESDQLVGELAEPFLWPLSKLMRASGALGRKDYLAADKRFVKMFCFQIAFNAIHILLFIVALLSIGFSI